MGGATLLAEVAVEAITLAIVTARAPGGEETTIGTEAITGIAIAIITAIATTGRNPRGEMLTKAEAATTESAENIS